jgi:uncharacterized membrane protein YhaH (DUF805 family)
LSWAALPAEALSLDDRWIDIIIVLIVLYPLFVIDVKRGHDRNIATWIIATYYTAPAGRFLLVEFGWLKRLPNQSVFSAIDIVSFALAMVLGILVLLSSSNSGFARDGGPEPVRTRPAR